MCLRVLGNGTIASAEGFYNLTTLLELGSKKYTASLSLSNISAMEIPLLFEANYIAKANQNTALA